MILLPNRTPPRNLLWYGILNVPTKTVMGIMDATDIVGCVAGTKPLLRGNTVYGRPPGRAGYLSFYTDIAGLWDAAINNPDIYYYWSRPRPLKGTHTTPLTKAYTRGRNPNDEPWHKWSDGKIAEVIAAVALDLTENHDINSVCLQHGISHFGFKELFQSRYPEAYIKYAKYNKIPTRDRLTQELSKRFPHLSIVTE